MICFKKAPPFTTSQEFTKGRFEPSGGESSLWLESKYRNGDGLTHRANPH